MSLFKAAFKRVQDGPGFAPVPAAPSNIDPQAAAILNSSARMVREILEKRAGMDRAGQQDAPLFVAMGEHHFRPAHKLHHIAVIKGLFDAGEKAAVTLEQPHDFLAKSFCGWAGIDTRDDVMNGLEGRDSDGKIVLSHFAAHGAMSANYASRLFHDYLYRKNIPACLTDASRRKGTEDGVAYIDTRDAQSRVSLSQFADPDQPCGRRSQEGVAARNYCMTAESEKFARETGARIVLQQCGMAHASGTHDFDIGRSLSGAFKSRNLQAISMLLDGKFYHRTPSEEDFRTAGHHVLIDSQMPRDEFQLAADRKTTKAEIFYTRRLLDGMGLSGEFGSAGDLEERRLAYHAGHDKTMRQWAGEFGLPGGAIAALRRFACKSDI